MYLYRIKLLQCLTNKSYTLLTFKHMYASLRVVSHSIHEDEWQELGKDNSYFGTNQFISDHLGQQRSSFLTHCWVLRVTKQLEEVYQSTWTEEGGLYTINAHSSCHRCFYNLYRGIVTIFCMSKNISYVYICMH